jgi:hypothetical protein
MYRNIVNTILYWLSIVFLIGSLYVYLFEKEDFVWQSLFGTDGLTFFGILATLITMASMRIPFIRKLLSWLLLKINYSQLDYSFEVIVEAPSDIKLESFKQWFFSSIASNGSIRDNTYNVNSNTLQSYKIYHRGLGSNFNIKKIPVSNSLDVFDDTVPEYNLWKIESDGVSTFRIVERNIKFFINSYLENLNHQRILPNKVVLKISKKNTEFNLIDKGILIDSRKYKINRSNIDILNDQNTLISLNSDIGITLTAKNKGDFSNAFDALKNILIS